MLKSTLCSLQIYFMSLLLIPRGMTFKTRKLSGISCGRGSSWEKTLPVIHLQNKKLGGLGIRVLFSLNKALLLKWCWRERVPLETGHSGKVRGNIVRLVLSCREGGAWCWLVESDKSLGSFWGLNKRFGRQWKKS